MPGIVLSFCFPPFPSPPRRLSSLVDPHISPFPPAFSCSTLQLSSSLAPVSQPLVAPFPPSSGHNVEPAAPQTPLIGTAACPLRPQHPARAGGESSSAPNGRRPTQEDDGMGCGDAFELAQCERPRHRFAGFPKHSSSSSSSSSSKRTSGICPWECRKLQLQQQN